MHASCPLRAFSPVAPTFRGAAVAALVALAPPTGVAAQARPRDLAADLWLGLGMAAGPGRPYGSTGTSGFAGGLTAAWRLRPLAWGTLLTGAAASVYVPFDSEWSCPAPVSGDPCFPVFPTFRSVSGLVGWRAQHGRRGAALRLLAGPGAYVADGRVTPGLTGRADLATPSLAGVALTAWGQSELVPRLRGGTYRVPVAGVGLRVQMR